MLTETLGVERAGCFQPGVDPGLVQTRARCASSSETVRSAMRAQRYRQELELWKALGGSQ